MDLRLFYLSAHYSKPQNFTFDALNSSKESYNNLKKLVLKHKNGTNKIEQTKAYRKLREAAKAIYKIKEFNLMYKVYFFQIL